MSLFDVNDTHDPLVVYCYCNASNVSTVLIRFQVAAGLGVFEHKFLTS